MECWSDGVLECWSVGVLEYWSIGLAIVERASRARPTFVHACIFCRAATAPDDDPVLHYSATPLLQYSITPPLHYSITPLLHYSITPPLHYSFCLESIQIVTGPSLTSWTDICAPNTPR